MAMAITAQVSRECRYALSLQTAAELELKVRVHQLVVGTPLPQAKRKHERLQHECNMKTVGAR